MNASTVLHALFAPPNRPSFLLPQSKGLRASLGPRLTAPAWSGAEAREAGAWDRPDPGGHAGSRPSAAGEERSRLFSAIDHAPLRTDQIFKSAPGCEGGARKRARRGRIEARVDEQALEKLGSGSGPRQALLALGLLRQAGTEPHRLLPQRHKLFLGNYLGQIDLKQQALSLFATLHALPPPPVLPERGTVACVNPIAMTPVRANKKRICGLR